MLDKLNELETRFKDLERQLSDPELVNNQAKYREVTKEYKDTEKIMSVFRELQKVQQQIEDDNQILAGEDDADLLDMARAELHELKDSKEKLEDRLTRMLLPKDANDEKNAIVEIRAGTGGEEAALFAADIYRMYTRYAENKRWKIEVMSSNATGIGGLKEIIFMIKGEDVFSRLKLESGVHRVQRVPETESSGRIHTSAISVAILPEAEEVELNVPQNEIKMDVYRSSGPGGQSVNTTDSAVRLTHLPTGLKVTCQDEKSQHKNRAKAMTILMARLKDKIESEQHDERAQNRKLQVGSGDRSEKIRTYNYPQNRITDHRVNYTSHDLDKVLEGELDGMLDVLMINYQNELMDSLGEDNG